MTVLLPFCALGVGIGLVGLVTALRQASRPTPAMAAMPWRSDWSKKFGPPLIAALGVGLVTRWPTAGLLAALAAAALPSMLRSTSGRESTRRTEAVAVWTELLRDTLTASAGLAQAIVATAEVAPDEVRLPVSHLADRIMSGVSMDEALRLFAREVDDPSAADVVSALRLAATSRAQRLVELLGALAESTRDEVTMRLKVEASRASARSGVRTVIVFSIGFVVLLMLVARSYLAPYGSLSGQLVLVIVGACYAAGLALMVRLVRPDRGRTSSRKSAPT